jgi:ParB family chromosome partitioning protein
MKTGKGQKSKAKSKAKPKAKTMRISPKKTKLAA